MIKSTSNWLTDGSEYVFGTEDKAATGNVLANAQTQSGDISVSNFSFGSQTALAGSSLSVTGIGSVQIKSNGEYTFTPAADYNGEVPQISYNVNNGTSQMKSALHIRLEPVADNLADRGEVTALPNGTDISGNVLANAQSENGQAWVGSFYYVNGTAVETGTAHTLTDKGVTVQLNRDGSYSASAGADAKEGEVVVQYIATNGEKRDDSALSLKIGAANGDSLVSDISESILFVDKQATGNLLDNAATTLGTPLISSYAIGGTVYSAGRTVSLDDGMGTLRINADGSYVLNAARVINANELNIQYTVTNGTASVVSDFKPEVNPYLSPFPNSDIAAQTYPIQDGAENINSNNPNGVSGNLLDNVASFNRNQPDAELSVLRFTVNGEQFDAGNTATLSGVGTVRITADGSFVFSPVPGFTGKVPTLSYELTDNYAVATSELNINIPAAQGITLVNAGDNSTGKVSVLNGGTGSDVLVGDSYHSDSYKATNDTLSGGGGHDVLFGDTINIDHLSWNANGSAVKGSDYKNAMDGLRDYVAATANNGAEAGEHQVYEYMSGNWTHLLDNQIQGGDDIIMGGAGDDILIGGAGNDHLTGGAGSDVFVFNLKSNGGHDQITGFAAGQDKIMFVGLEGAGQLSWDAANHTLSYTSVQDGASYDNSIVINGIAADFTMEDILGIIA